MIKGKKHTFIREITNIACARITSIWECYAGYMHTAAGNLQRYCKG